MKELTIDGQQMTSKNTLYTHLNRVFAFPNHFGNNLDALWDVLSAKNEATTICFTHTEKLMDQMDDYGEKLIQLFKRLEQENDNYTIYFYPSEIPTE